MAYYRVTYREYPNSGKRNYCDFTKFDDALSLLELLHAKGLYPHMFIVEK